MQYDTEPEMRPDTDPGAEFKERAIGTAFDVMRTMRDTCHMAIPNERRRVGYDVHPVTALQTHLGRILDSGRIEIQYEGIGERTTGDAQHHQHVQQGEDPGVHLHLSIRVWDDNGVFDAYSLHINTSGGGLIGRRITEADFRDAARQQGAQNHARRSEGNQDHPLEVNVVVSRKNGSDHHTISDATLKTSTVPRAEGSRIHIVPSVASGTYATKEEEILLLGDQEGNIKNPIRQEHAEQTKVNAMSSRLIEQARDLYRMREEAIDLGVKEDDQYFTSIASLLEQAPTALSA